MVLTNLGTLDAAYSSARPHIMGMLAVNSLAKTYHFLKSVLAPLSSSSIVSLEHSCNTQRIPCPKR